MHPADAINRSSAVMVMMVVVMVVLVLVVLFTSDFLEFIKSMNLILCILDTWKVFTIYSDFLIVSV